MTQSTLNLLAAQNRILREELDRCRAEIKLLRGRNERTELPEWFPRVRPLERRLLIALASGRVVSRETLMSQLYLHEADQPSDKILDVMVCHLRRRLRGLVSITTHNGFGYQLDQSSIAQIWNAKTVDAALVVEG